VRVDGIVVQKPGSPTSPGARITIEDPAGGYVSRAALKLIAGLDHFALDPNGRIALDIGASTGGFTQVLLERGAGHVLAVDVGHGQLHPTLADDPRVLNLEGINARALSLDHVTPHSIDCVVSDVSFISLKLALPPALSIAAPGAFCLLLVKPQFEVGRGGVGKGGIVRDVRLIEEACSDLTAWLDGLPGWSALGLIASPIEGGDGNREFLLAGTKR
jgi:23S rRNA (cytidine1920-2'-O)/16S rRNA (cytidine1409-2'-O)-methyltransferase